MIPYPSAIILSLTDKLFEDGRFCANSVEAVRDMQVLGSTKADGIEIRPFLLAHQAKKIHKQPHHDFLHPQCNFCKSNG
jgi:hypothetical protein